MNNTASYLPLLSTLLGGLLAISGGIASGLLIQKYSMRRENDKLLREKCEEIYKMILLLDHQTKFFFNAMMDKNIDSKPPEEVNLIQYEYKQLEMLGNLYFPAANTELNEYVKAREQLFLKYMHCIFNKSKIDDVITDEFISEIKKLDNNYDQKALNLKQKLQSEFPLCIRF